MLLKRWAAFKLPIGANLQSKDKTLEEVKIRPS
jgi:hypothetical protein